MADQQQPEYLDVLIWLETASEEQIRGALHVATGQVRVDIENGIKAMIESDRPALARIFTDLNQHLDSLSVLSQTHHELRYALREVAQAVRGNRVDTRSTPIGYWRVLRVLRSMRDSGLIRLAHQEVLADELHHRVIVSKEVSEWEF